MLADALSLSRLFYGLETWRRSPLPAIRVINAARLRVLRGEMGCPRFQSEGNLKDTEVLEHFGEQATDVLLLSNRILAIAKGISGGPAALRALLRRSGTEYAAQTIKDLRWLQQQLLPLRCWGDPQRITSPGWS